MDKTDIRKFRVTDESLAQHLDGNLPASFELYLSLLTGALDEGEVSKQNVALEILSKLVAHKTNSISVEDTIAMLPPQWRGEVVPVPLPILMALMEPYAAYAKAPELSTLGQVWGLEGKQSTGKRRSATRLKALRADLSVALEIEELYHLEKFLNRNAKVENLIQEVVDRRGVSEARTRRAYERFKTAARTYLVSTGLLPRREPA